jgi:hypothetical protein
MPALVKNHCTSAEEFLTRIRRSNDAWWPVDGSASPWVFRGIGDAENWGLLPSAWRASHNKLSPLLAKIRLAKLSIACDDGPDNIWRRCREWHAAEQEALFQFAKLANETGFSVSSVGYSPENSPLATGLAHLIRGEHGPPNIELMALAQHHGIPTRLLDWSGNPIVAAFFAASPLFRPQKATRMTVWALDTSQIQIAGQEPRSFGKFRLLIHSPARGQNQFLHSQVGLMTELLGTEHFFSEHSAWPSLEDVFRLVSTEQPILIGHTLDSQHIPRLLLLLDREGMNSAVLMPTLDNVAKTVISRWQNET